MKRIFIVAVVAGLGLQALDALAQTPPQMPPWYLATGLPVTDTDEDGIPDAWEIRTFGDPAVADSGLDRDGDGLTDLEEFNFGSDPRTFSTMGDGWSDKEKSDAGLDSVFRVTPAVSLAQWQGWLDWSAESWLAFTATNEQGFVVDYSGFIYNTAPYSSGSGTVDFWLVTRTDRPAWLTVGDALTTNSFPVRAGISRVRLRAAYGGPVALTLDPHPDTLAQVPGATNGPWLCEMRVEPFGSNTVVFSDGVTPPTVPGDPDSVNGLILSAPQPGTTVHSLTSPPPRVIFQPLRMTDGSTVLGNGGWYCLCASEPSCAWPNYAMIGCDSVSMAMNSVDGGTPILSKEDARDIYAERYPCIQCTVTQTVANATYPFIYGKVIFPFRQCEAHGGVIGAEQSQPWHEPDYSDHSWCRAIGCVCDDGPQWVVGFDHWLVNTRNLNHPTESPESDKYINHCLGVVWSVESLNLADLCESCGLDLSSLAVWEVNDVRLPSSMLVPGGEPPDLKPNIIRVKMLQASNPDIEWDRIFIVVNHRNTRKLFDDWYDRFSVETNWLAELPAAYRSVNGPPTTNIWGQVRMQDPEPPTINLWANKVDHPGTYMHHLAEWQMRSKMTTHGHGNQACYDDQNRIILSGISAGTADFGCADGYNSEHVENDVEPFVRALQLDGNPCQRSLWNLTHALIFDGDNLHKYRDCRPAIPNDKPLLNPGETPQ